MKTLTALAAIALIPLAACSSGKDDPAAMQSGAQSGTQAASDAMDTGAAMDSATTGPAAMPAPAASAGAQVLGLEGLGDLKIGQAVPAGSSWASRGAQESDACTTVSSPDYPGVYAIVEGGKVRRITLGANSKVKLAEGIGVGASEMQVNRAFGGFREEGHKYEDAPAKYLTAPNARPGESALRFEIGRNGRVSAIHVGEMPTLAYVEGCS